MTGDEATSTRRALLGAAALGAAATGGCLTLGPRVRSPELADSDVFASLSVREPWAAGRIAVRVRLAPAATTDAGVRRLVVVDGSGSKFDAATLESGEATATLFVPASGRSTLSAADYEGRSVESIRLSPTGRAVP